MSAQLPANLRARINELLMSDPPPNADEMRVYFAALREVHDHAAKLLARYFVAFIAIWASLYAIAANIVAEGSWASLKLSNAHAALVVGPPVLGTVFYLMMSALASSTYAARVIRLSYHHRWPKLVACGLAPLIFVPTAFSVERLLTSVSKGTRFEHLHTAWTVVMTAAVLFGTAFAVLQSVYFAATQYPGSKLAVTAASIVGILFWSRGLFLVFVFMAWEGTDDQS